ncbi:glutamate racemase [Thermovibrio ammonificans]|uniref:Glutamate racemase n=1 Tax=Thermovibrio ammonificans (strain DSM 15698 / JCM 12110 / HB-1) TaxID=648996 RepID=E8T3H7_THEA1|nr:glutamate racemase [Thermovibrio ammonificans]ADU96108.1 glutamate racemase [Thermovibrio ammonificans HB-1]
MDDRPIGVFDSGVGGLTVLKALRELLPDENLIYFGDTARVPYGTKSPKTIIKFSIQNTKLLESYGVKMVVVACNTSSAHALEILQEEFPFPVVGVVEPGAKEAVKSTDNRRVGVIGTEATVKSEAYRKAIVSLDPFCTVFQKACPLFVPLIEEGWLKDPVTLEVARRYLGEFKEFNVDTLVLGCTHYPLIKEVIGEVLPGIRLVDSAEAVAREVKRLLPYRRKGSGGAIKVLVSDKTERFERIARLIMGEPVEIEEVKVDKE